jgi:hypothetical protein
LITAKSFHFFRRLKFFTHFTSFATDFNIQHTHTTLWDLPKNTLLSRETETHNLLSTELIRENRGKKKALADHFFMQTKRVFTNFLLWQEKKPPSQRSPRGLCKATLEHEMHLIISGSLWYKIIGKIKTCIIEYIQLHICAWEVRIWVQVESGWQIHLNWIGESLGDTSCI